VVSASAASPLVERAGVKPVLLTGLAAFAAGLAWLALIPAARSLPTSSAPPS
jgi:hypothetical protein